MASITKKDLKSLTDTDMLQMVEKVKFWTGKNTSYFDESFIKNYSDSSDKGCLEVDGKCSKEFNDSYNYLPFLPERVKIKKCQTHVRNFYDSRKVCCVQEKYVVHIRTLKQALNMN